MPTFGVLEGSRGPIPSKYCLPNLTQSSAQPLETSMFVRRSLLVLAVALSVARCADQPTAVKAPAAPQFLRWADKGPQFTARTSTRPHRSGAMAMTPPLSLDQYVVSFWAVPGDSRSAKLHSRRPTHHRP